LLPAVSGVGETHKRSAGQIQRIERRAIEKMNGHAKLRIR
jgi:hypothetical protein